MVRETSAEKPPISTTIPGLFFQTCLCGILSGLLVMLVDFTLLYGNQEFSAGGVIRYASSLAILAGFALGASSGVALVVGRCLFGKLRWTSLGSLPLGLALGYLIYSLNADLFRGPAISQKSWADTAERIVLPTLAIGSCLATLFATAWALGAKKRRFILFVVTALALAIFGLANFGWGPFGRLNAYPDLKLQFALLTWICGAVIIYLPFSAFPTRALRSGCATLALVILALGLAYVERGEARIYQVRSTIENAPMVGVAKIQLKVEEALLNRLRPMKGLLDNLDVDLDTLSAGQDGGLSARKLQEYAPNRGAFNVIWIAVDALRADHLGCYGYERQLSPNINQLATQSVLFERALTPAPASNFAYSATLSGLAARHSEAYFEYYKTKSPVPQDHSLAATLKQKDRWTAAVTAFPKSVQNRSDFRVMANGFDSFNHDDHVEEIDAVQVTDLALGLVDRAEKVEKRPFFLFLHYIDPHGPYTAHKEHDYGPTAIDNYDSEIRYCDEEIGRLLRGLEQRQLDKNTVIVFFADHGESFGEHNKLRHGTCLYQHQTHVPLLVRIPGVPPQRRKEWVTLSDLVPTTMAILGQKDDSPRLGRDLTPLLVNTASDWLDLAYVERPASPKDRFSSRERGVWQGDLKLTWKPQEDTFQVFNLAKDPGELSNIFNPSLEEHKQLLAYLKAMDKKIDSFWGGDQAKQALVPAKTNELSAKLTLAVKALTGAQANEAAAKAIRAITALLGDRKISWNPDNRDQFEDADLQSLRGFIEGAVQSSESKALDLNLAARILVFCNNKSSMSALKTIFEGSKNNFIKFRIAGYFADHGDQTGLEFLKQSLEVVNFREKIKVALSLAKLGDPSGRKILAAAMHSSRLTDMMMAAEGLAEIADPRIFEQVLFDEGTKWRSNKILSLVVDGASQLDDPLTTAALILLCFSEGEEKAERARSALASRLSQAELGRINALFLTLFGAKESLRYGRFEEAERPLNSFSPQDQKLLGPLKYLAVRNKHILKNKALHATAFETLRQTVGKHSNLIKFLERDLVALNAAPDLIDYSQCPIQGELVSFEYDEPAKPHGPFLVTVKLSNKSNYFVEGGPFRGCLRIAVANKKDGEYLRPFKMNRPLPIAGLLPGEEIVIQYWDRFPAGQTSFDADLTVIVSENSRKPVKLMTLPQLKIN